MESKKINQLATNVNPQTSDLTTIGDPVTGQLKKITWLQVAHLIGAQASLTLQDVTNQGATTTLPITTGGLTLSNLDNGVLKVAGGAVSTYPYGQANGVASLDSGGKVPASQLPSSIMDYKGTWNAATNTPTLVNGTGDTGDVYRCNVAGTVNFGAGNITFKVGDWAIYNGTIWEQSNNSDAVSSVFGRTGDITAQEGDYNIGQLGDVTITSAATNDYLRYNGTGWVNTQFPTFVSSDKLVLQVRNNSGATINKGTVVYINGATAGYPTIAKAQADADNTSAQTLGLVQDNISNNSNGVVVIVGQITGIDTSAYPAGTQLYLSGTTAGAFTSTKTLAPTHLVYVGIVTTQNAVNGVIEVKIQNGYELDEIHDVAISSVANNQGLFYESSTSLWKNKSIATVLGYTPEQPLTFSSPLVRTTNTISIPAATGSVNGYLTSTDWTTFNNKMTNPMTTLGDIIFGGTSGNPNRLAGNITTTKQYLSQTGTGTDSASPTWATITGSDITGAALTKTDDTNVTLTLGGTPATALLRAASLTLGWIGTLAVSRGGTGASSFGSNEIIYGNSASALQSSNQFTFSPTGVFFINNTISAGGIAMNLTSTVNAAANNDIIYGVRISPTFNNLSFTGVTQRALGVFGNVYINGTITSGAWNGSVIGSNYGGAGTVSGILKANGSGVVSAAVAGTDYQAPLTNPVTGTGSNNYIAKFTTTGSTIGSSQIFDNGTNVGINTSTLTSLLTVLGSGGATNGITYGISDTQKEQTLMESRTVGLTVGDTTEVCSIVFGNGAGYIEINLIGHVSADSVSAKYILPVQYANSMQTDNVWLEALPISSRLTFSGELSIRLDIKVSTSTATIRLRRPTTRTQNSVYTLSIKVLGNSYTYTSSSTAASGVSAPSSFYYGANMVMNGDGFVGINKNNPQYSLDVTGDARFTSNLTASISAFASASDRFVISDGGMLKYRTAAQVLSDIGAAASSSLSNYLPLTGGTLTGALNGTNATFNGNITLNGSVTRSINFYNDTNSNLNAQIQYDQIASNSGQLFFGTNNAGTFATRLTIGNTGAATFSSAAAGYGLSVTNVQDSSQGLLVRASDNDTSLYLARFQSSVGATSQTWVDRFIIAKNGSTVIGDNIPATNVRLWVKGEDQTASNYALDVTDSVGQSIAWFRNDKAIRFNGQLTSNYAYNGGGTGMIHLTSSGTEGGSITFEKTSGTAQKYKLGNSGSALFIYNETAGNQPFTILNGGKVGIVETSPSTTLDIKGDLRVQGGGTSGVNYAVLNLFDVSSGGSNWALLQGFPSLGDFTIRESGVANWLVIKKTTGNSTFLGNVVTNSAAEGNTGEGIIAGRSFKIDASGSGQTAKMYVVSNTLSDTYGSGLQIQFAKLTNDAGFGFNLNTQGAYETYVKAGAGSWNRAMIITSGRNFGINTVENPQTKLQVDAASATASSTVFTIYGSGVGFSGSNDADTAYSMNFDGCSYKGTTGVVPRTGAQIQMLKSGSWNEANTGGGTKASLIFKTNNGTIDSPDLTERMRITNGGYLKASNNGTYRGATDTYHEFLQTANDRNTIFRSTNASYTSNILLLDAVRSANSAYSFLFANSNDNTDREFDLRGDGQGYCDGSWNGGGADYAEYFEWADGNINNEDRRGMSVSLIGNKIKIAEQGECVIGVISGNPSVVGDAAWNKWNGKYLRDEFNSYILDVEGNRTTNPKYNENMEYIPREKRPEWSAVGLVGKLRVRKGQATMPTWIKMRDITDTIDEWLVK